MTPRILVSASKDGWENYEKALRAAGAEPEGCYCPPVDLNYDGLLLTGGGDIFPQHYGQEMDGSQPPDHQRDEAELALAKAYLEAGKPILGVCRGHQLLNVALGGTLKQDVGDFLRPFHAHAEGEPDLAHAVQAAPGSLFEQLYGAHFSVNSWHHQVLDELGEGVVANLHSEGGLVEGFTHATLPVVGVQFHPERMTGDLVRPDTVDGAPIFEHFLSLCGK